LILSGQGYDSFRQTFGENSLLVEEKNGLRTLTVAVDISSWVTTAQTTELTLRGGKILAHNGTLLNETTVQWIDSYGTMTATMQEPSWLDYLPWVILGGGTLLVLFSGIGLLVLWSKMHKKLCQAHKLGHESKAPNHLIRRLRHLKRDQRFVSNAARKFHFAPIFVLCAEPNNPKALISQGEK
jgi:hypothetical protein